MSSAFRRHFGGFREPPRPAKTLADIRREDYDAWRVFQYCLREWIARVVPEAVPGDFGAQMLPHGICPKGDGVIAGEAKHEAIERLLDMGYMRMKIRRPAADADPIGITMDVWDGRQYRRVGRGGGE